MPKDSQNICDELKSTVVCCVHCYIHQKWKETEKAAASVSFIQIFVHLMICSLLQKARGIGTKKDMVVTEMGNEDA